MGVLDKVGDVFRNRRELNVLLVGLDYSGKSTIVNSLKQPPEKKSPVEVQPTIGMAEETLRLKSSAVVVFDMSGQGRYRSMWERRLDDCQAIVFVVDSSDRLRMIIAKEELYLLGNHATVRERRLPFLFFINKLDTPGAMSPARIANALAIDRLFGRKNPWKLIGCNALAGIGVHEGFEWLIQYVLNAGDDGMSTTTSNINNKQRASSQQSPSLTPPLTGGAERPPFVAQRKPTLTSLVMSSTTTSMPPGSNSKMKKSKSSALVKNDAAAANSPLKKAAMLEVPPASSEQQSVERNTAANKSSEKRKFTNWFRRSSSSKP